MGLAMGQIEGALERTEGVSEGLYEFPDRGEAVGCSLVSLEVDDMLLGLAVGRPSHARVSSYTARLKGRSPLQM